MSVHNMNLPRIKRRSTVLRPSIVFKPVDYHPTNIEDDLDSTHRMYVLKTKDFVSAGSILKRYGAKHKKLKDGFSKRVKDGSAPTIMPSSIYDTAYANAIRVNKPTFPEDTVEEIVQLSTFPDNMALRLRTCSFCFENVPLGAHRIECVSCPVVAHISCIHHISKFVITSQEQPLPHQHDEQQLNKPHSSSNRNNKVRSAVSSSSKHNAEKETKSSSSVSGSHIHHQKSQQRPTTSPAKLPGTLDEAHRIKTSKSTPTIAVQKNLGLKGLVANDIRWTCDFCRGEIKVTNIYKRNKHIEKFNEVLILSSVLKLQAFFRMCYHRSRYCIFMNGIVALQEMFRIRKLKIQNEIRKSNLKRPFRIRLHDINLMIPKRPNTFSSSSSSSNINATGSSSPSEVRATSPSNSPDSNGKSSFNKAVFPSKGSATYPPKSNLVVVGESTALVYENVFGIKKNPNATVRDKDKDMVDLLAAGHVENPIYCKPHKQFQPSFRGSLFLTTTFYEVANKYGTNVKDNGKDNAYNILKSKNPEKVYDQICRMDFPLKVMSPAMTLKPSTLARLGYEGDLEKISKTYQLVTFNISKSPYILIPFMGSNIEMRMTVSEITEYPHSIVIGQSCSSIHYQLFHERIASYRQPLYDTVNGADFIELPHADDGCKLIFYLPDQLPVPQPAMSKVSSTSKSSLNGNDEDLKHFYGNSTNPVDQSSLFLPRPNLRRDGSANGKAQKANQHPTSIKSSNGKVSDSNHHISVNGNTAPLRGNSASAAGNNNNNNNNNIRSRDLIPSRYIGGFISWSILPLVNSEYSNEAGFLLLLSQEYMTANKRKCWCILIDRIFFIYSINKHGHEVTLKQQIEMSQVQISILDQDIIQLKTSTETLFFHCLTQKEHNIWFRKLYMLSASNENLPYHIYMKRLSRLGLQHGKSFNDFDELMKHGEVNMQLQISAIKHLRHQYNNNIQPKIVQRSSTEQLKEIEEEIDHFLTRMENQYVDFDGITFNPRLTEEHSSSHQPPSPHHRAGQHHTLIDALVASVRHAKHVKLG